MGNFETQTFSKKFNEQLKKEKVATVMQGLSDILEDGSMMVEEQNQGTKFYVASERDRDNILPRTLEGGGWSRSPT